MGVCVHKAGTLVRQGAGPSGPSLPWLSGWTMGVALASRVVTPRAPDSLLCVTHGTTVPAQRDPGPTGKLMRVTSSHVAPAARGGDTVPGPREAGPEARETCAVLSMLLRRQPPAGRTSGVAGTRPIADPPIFPQQWAQCPASSTPLPAQPCPWGHQSAWGVRDGKRLPWRWSHIMSRDWRGWKGLRAGGLEEAQAAVGHMQWPPEAPVT